MLKPKQQQILSKHSTGTYLSLTANSKYCTLWKVSFLGCGRDCRQALCFWYHVVTIEVSLKSTLGVPRRQPHRRSGLATCPLWELSPSHLILLYDLLCYTCMLYLSTILCVTVYAYVYFVFSLFSELFSSVDFPSVL